MKYFYLPFLLLSIFSYISGCSPAKHIQNQSPILVIKNINVIDVEAGIVRHSQDVVVHDQKIAVVSDSFTGITNSNTTYVDGTGKYLMPGLWDMHFHLCWQINNDSLLFPILLKNGITGIRDMGGDLIIAQTFKSRIKQGILTAPEIYIAGPMIDGNPPVQPEFSFPVDDKTNMKKALDSLKTNGADFFKSYSLIKEKQLRDIANFCLANSMTFAGHLSEYVEPEVSIALGQKSVEHVNRLDEIWQTNKPRIDSIGRMMVSQQTFLCPTLITYQLKTRLRDSSVVKADYDQYISPSLMKEWKMLWTGRIQKASKNVNWDHLDQVYASQKQLINHLNKMGVMILAGSDFAGMPYVYPGIGLLEELILLSASGLTNAMVLRTATINPAIFMSKQKWYGSVTPGKFADLLILDKNPLEEIRNIHTIHSVFVKGKIVK